MRCKQVSLQYFAYHQFIDIDQNKFIKMQNVYVFFSQIVVIKITIRDLIST